MEAFKSLVVYKSKPLGFFVTKDFPSSRAEPRATVTADSTEVFKSSEVNKSKSEGFAFTVLIPISFPSIKAAA